MGRRINEGAGTLPLLDEESKPAPKPRIRQGSAPRRQVPGWRMIAIGTAVIVFGLAALYAWHTAEQFIIRDSRFALNGPEGLPETATLEVAGANHASSRRIEAVFAEDSGRSVYLLPLADRRAALRNVEWVKDASVVRLWPNRVVVRVWERTPVAFVTIAPSRYGLIDEDGVILPPATDKFELPVLAGVSAADPIPQRRDRVHRMLRLVRELGDTGAQISRIDVTDPDNVKVSQPWEGRVVTLLLGDHNFKLRYQNFNRNYPEIKRRLPDAATLDMRLEDRITVVDP